MKHLKLFENFQNIDSICRRYGIENYTVNPDGSVDVDGDVNLSQKRLTKLPLKFGRITGNFVCSFNQLTTLEGSPREVGGHFVCSFNQLTTLEGGPTEVGGDFNCSHNPLTSNSCEIEIRGYFFTTFSEKGLIINNYNIVTNKEEWQKLIKRKRILNELYTRHM